MSFSLRGLNHTARDTFLGGKVRQSLLSYDWNAAQVDNIRGLDPRCWSRWAGVLEMCVDIGDRGFEGNRAHCASVGIQTGSRVSSAASCAALGDLTWSNPPLGIPGAIYTACESTLS